MNDLILTITALRRVLAHLEYPNNCTQQQQANIALARVLVQRRLSFAEQSAEILWQAAKDAQ